VIQHIHNPIHIALIEKGFHGPLKKRDHVFIGIQIFPEVKQDLDEVIDQNVKVLLLLLLLNPSMDLALFFRSELTSLNDRLALEKRQGLF
jgi:hypothetical protein